MTIIDWLKHNFTADRAAYFARPAQDQRLPLDDRRLVELLSSNEGAAGNLEEIAKLLGQTPKPPVNLGIAARNQYEK